MGRRIVPSAPNLANGMELRAPTFFRGCRVREPNGLPKRQPVL